MKYRLNRAEKKAVTLYYVPQTKRVNGKDIVTYPANFMKLVPGEEYETEDQAMIDYFQSFRQETQYTKELENTFEKYGIPYEIKMCKSCGGRVKKLKYQLVEVYDE